MSKNWHHECETSGSEHQRGQVMCCSLQGCLSAQRLCIHGGEDAVEAGQRPGLNPLHPAQRRHFKKVLCREV